MSSFGKVIGAALGLAAVVTAVMLIQRGNVLGKMWAITYEASSTGNQPISITFQETRGRYPGEDRSVKEHTLPAVQAPWSKEVTVFDGKEAKVTVTPPPGGTAGCRILLDGEKVLVENTSAPDKPVVCTATP
ncbi:hypothetical protein [Streptomyces sp. WZ-12]|uniref:hypothetical protein n=1 Tax=Streptomyces sp. WZ-12 TaxID=3030210 RepID=UPI0023814FE5|nr:hypothetical protein [Streptomyces sp. WZ-12]